MGPFPVPSPPPPDEEYGVITEGLLLLAVDDSISTITDLYRHIIAKMQ
jgi:hypothetical protein